MVHTIPEGMKPGSDTANLAVLGYDPKKYYSGRSPLEALSIGVPMKDTDIAIRCNIVTISEDDVPFEEKRSSTTAPMKSVPRTVPYCSMRSEKSWRMTAINFMSARVTGIV